MQSAPPPANSPHHPTVDGWLSRLWGNHYRVRCLVAEPPPLLHNNFPQCILSLTPPKSFAQVGVNAVVLGASVIVISSSVKQVITHCVRAYMCEGEGERKWITYSSCCSPPLRCRSHAPQSSSQQPPPPPPPSSQQQQQPPPPLSASSVRTPPIAVQLAPATDDMEMGGESQQNEFSQLKPAAAVGAKRYRSEDLSTRKAAATSLSKENPWACTCPNLMWPQVAGGKPPHHQACPRQQYVAGILKRPPEVGEVVECAGVVGGTNVRSGFVYRC